LGQGNRNSVAAYVEVVSGRRQLQPTEPTWYHVRVHRNRRRTPSRLGYIIHHESYPFTLCLLRPKNGIPSILFTYAVRKIQCRVSG